MSTQEIDTGDHVLHAPSGESWVVAYVRGDRLAWCGWPQGEAALADCTLLKKATDAERDTLLREMAACGRNDPRCSYAVERLARAAWRPTFELSGAHADRGRCTDADRRPLERRVRLHRPGARRF